MLPTNYQLPATNFSAKGFTLIESLVFLFLFAVISMAFLEVYATGTRLIIESKNRLGAVALANQKMEIIRSIDYETIGTKRWNGSSWVYGIPPGDILEDETLSVNNRSYRVQTFVQYVDDPYDGRLGASPSDAIPTDYKRVRLTVSWGEQSADQNIALVSTVAAEGMEQASSGGVLSINVLDAAGLGVANATVQISNPAAGVSLTAQTDGTGNLLLPGAPAGSQNYEITVSKSDYYGAASFPPFPTTSYNPVDVHGSVVNGSLNQYTIVMAPDADIRLVTEDPFGNSLPNIGFTLSGGRILGTTPATGDFVYGFSESGSTAGSGEAEYLGESYGQYTISTSDDRYQFFKLTPEGSAPDTADVAPGTTADLKVVLLDEEFGSVKVEVTNANDDSPIAGAEVRLSNTDLAYDDAVTTDAFGFAYFPETEPELVEATYDLEVSLTGYQTANENVTVNSGLVTESVGLTPN